MIDILNIFLEVIIREASLMGMRVESSVLLYPMESTLPKKSQVKRTSILAL